MAVAIVSIGASTAVQGYIVGLGYHAIVGAIAGALVGGAIAGAMADPLSEPELNSTAGMSSALANKRSNNAPLPLVYGSRRMGGTIVHLDVTTDPETQKLRIILRPDVEYFAEEYEAGRGHWTPQPPNNVTWHPFEEVTDHYNLPANGATKQQAIDAWRARYGSPYIYEDTGEIADFGALPGNEYLHIILAICEGEIGGFDDVYLNDVNINDDKFDGYAEVHTHNGSDGQSADSTAVSQIDGWNAQHTLSGVAYVYVKLKYNADSFPNGLPAITCDIDGQEVYDPRSGSTSFSRNPAVCIRDYLTNTRYGRGIDTALIDDTTFNAAANYCDENVTIGGASKNRYELEGIVDTSQGSMDILKKLLTACRGFLIFSGGKYKLVIDKPETANFTFSEDNIVGSWSIAMGNKNNQFNRIRANFFNPARDWQADIAIVDSSALRTQDNGLLLERTIDLPFTADIDRAKMISTINLNQSRQQVAVEFNATIDGLRCEVGDVVYIKHKTPAWHTLNSDAGKMFRVMRLSIQNDSEVRITALEYDVTSYDFGTIAISDATPNTNLPDALSTLPPAGISVREDLYYTIGGAGLKVRAYVNWIASTDIFVVKYEVEYHDINDWVYLSITRTSNLQTQIYDIKPGIYNFRVKSINSYGISSDWAYLKNHTIEGLKAPPVDVDGLSLITINNAAHLSWDLATDLDVLTGGKVRFKHSNLTSGANWSSSTDIGSAVAGHSTNTVLPLLTGTYMAKFVDSTGNESTGTSSFVSTTVPNIVKMNAVTTLTENPAFSGVKTNMSAPSGILKLEADTLIDTMTDLIDDWVLIDAIGGLDTSGTYKFSNYIDLGATYTSRVTVGIAFTALVVSDVTDDRTALIDDWSDFDNVPANVTTNLFISTTTDNPSSSPTWSAWAKFTVADYSARAFKFKLEAFSTDADHQINITALSATIDMPDQVQGDSGIQSGVGTKSVVYPSAFFATPAIGITGSDMGYNHRIVLSNETATGFDVTFYHGSGTSYPQDIKFNWLARGY